jgi:hypothetical protein
MDERLADRPRFIEFAVHDVQDAESAAVVVRADP